MENEACRYVAVPKIPVIVRVYWNGDGRAFCMAVLRRIHGLAHDSQMLYLLFHQRMDLPLNGYNGVCEDCCSGAENFRTCSADSADYLPGHECKHIRKRGMELMPCSWGSWVVCTNCTRKYLRSVPCLLLRRLCLLNKTVLSGFSASYIFGLTSK